MIPNHELATFYQPTKLFSHSILFSFNPHLSQEGLWWTEGSCSVAIPRLP